MTQAVSNALVKDKLPGSIVNISSIVAKMGNIGQANYSASKGGVISMTKTCARELSGYAGECLYVCVCGVGWGVYESVHVPVVFRECCGYIGVSTLV